MTKAERIVLYQGYLEQLGYAPQLDTDGDLVFEIAFQNDRPKIFLAVDDSDEAFASLIWPWFWEIEPAKQTAMEVADQVNGSCKCVKITLSSNGTHLDATVDMLVGQPQNLEPILPQAFSFLIHGVLEFAQNMYLSGLHTSAVD